MTMKEFNMPALSEYTTEEIKSALESNQKILDDKPPQTLATAMFWKAVENRLKLQRELFIRGEIEDAPVSLPADRLPLLTIEPTEVIITGK